MRNEFDYEAQYKSFVELYLKRALTSDDGISEEKILFVERDLGFRLPIALRIYYKILGRCDELNNHHNRLINLKQIFCEDGFLIFLEENQYVSYWGIKPETNEDDPIIWQIQNEEPAEIYSEKKTFTEFMTEMFEWQFNL